MTTSKSPDKLSPAVQSGKVQRAIYSKHNQCVLLIASRIDRNSLFAIHQPLQQVVTVLDKLHKIDWTNLNHAYGSAIDVPGQIQALAASDSRDRAAAYNSLFYSIYHQGTVYSATLQAVPFLVELLNDDTTSDKPKLLSLLHCLASGGSHGSASWIAPAVREVVAKALPQCEHLLAQGDVETRMLAARLLGAYPDRGDLQPVLRSRLNGEGDSSVIATILFALNEFPIDDCTFLDLHARQTCQIVQFASCCFYFRHAPQFINETLLDVVIQFAAVFELSEEFEYIPRVRDVYLNTVAAEILAGLDLSHFPSLTQKLLDAIPTADLDGVDTVVAPLLTHLFPQRKRKLTSARSLNDFQREALQQIVQATSFWDPRGTPGRTVLLTRYGIPTERADVITFLN